MTRQVPTAARATHPRADLVDLQAMQLEVRMASLASPAAVRLIAELNEEIQARYSEPLESFYFSLERRGGRAGPRRVRPRVG